MLTIILVVGYFLFCVGMAFFLDYRTKKRKLNETAVEYSTGKNNPMLFLPVEYSTAVSFSFLFLVL